MGADMDTDETASLRRDIEAIARGPAPAGPVVEMPLARMTAVCEMRYPDGTPVEANHAGG